MRMKKRWKTILLSLCMALALIPAAAFAADTDKAIQLGTGSISGYDSTNWLRLYLLRHMEQQPHRMAGAVHERQQRDLQRRDRNG